MSNLRAANSKSESDLVLEALLDLYSHPVWITNGSGQVKLNSQAKVIQAQGCKFEEINNMKPLSQITIKGHRFRFGKWEMNHGTNCCLHELKEDDDGIASMHDGVNLLSAYLHSKS